MAAPTVDRRSPELPPTGRRAGERAERVRTPQQSLQRAMFYAHLWLGVLFTVVLLGVSITGIVLNHKRGLGLMPQVENPAPRPLAASLPLAALAYRARAAAGLDEATAPIDRMDVRPDDGYVKVRFDDPAFTEVTVDLATGAALHVGERGDVFMEQLHSGELFGKRWVYLTDAAAVALTLLLLSGYWLWLAPRWRRR